MRSLASKRNEAFVEWLRVTKNERKSRGTEQNQQLVFGHCTAPIESAIRNFGGVKDLPVDRQAGKAIFLVAVVEQWIPTAVYDTSPQSGPRKIPSVIDVAMSLFSFFVGTNYD